MQIEIIGFKEPNVQVSFCPLTIPGASRISIVWFAEPYRYWTEIQGRGAGSIIFNVYDGILESEIRDIGSIRLTAESENEAKYFDMVHAFDEMDKTDEHYYLIPYSHLQTERKGFQYIRNYQYQ